MIFDCHAHLASSAVLPKQFFDGWCATIKRSLPHEVSREQEQGLDRLFEQLRDDEGAEVLCRQMDDAGIDRAVLLVIDFGLVFGEEEMTLEEIHLEHRRIVAGDDRFCAFAGVDPRRGREGVELFEKAIYEWGFRGLKLYPPCGFSPSDSSLFPYYEICSAERIPVLTHTGPTSSALAFAPAHPMEVDRAAQQFPAVDFILGHGAIFWHRDASMLAEYRPNIYLDLSGFQAELNKNHFRQIIEWHVSRGLARRILFGTDWPIHRFWGQQSKWVETIRDTGEAAGFSKADLSHIMGGNLRRLLADRPE